MATKNDVLENEMELTGLPEEEKVLMNETDLINGLLEASGYAECEDIMKNIKIERAGKLLFQFKVHPLSEKEMMELRKQSTDRYKNPAGKHLPKIEGDLRVDEFRSRKIYAATTEKDRLLLWDNPKVKLSLNNRLESKGKQVIEAWEIIDYVLMAGEKFRVSNVIDTISGYDDEELELEDYAKN